MNGLLVSAGILLVILKWFGVIDWQWNHVLIPFIVLAFKIILTLLLIAVAVILLKTVLMIQLKNWKKMKTLKCPLCGGVPQFATKQIDEIEVCQILCKCGLATEVNEYWLNHEDDPEEDELRAWKDWEKLVSKFPPIMRVNVGDKLHFINRSLMNQYYAVVTDVDTNDSYIRTDKGTCRPDDVLKWPWELEQKGGQQ